MRTNILACTKCSESDYSDYMARINGRIYCQACYDEVLDKIENDIIDEVFSVPV